MAEMLLRDIPDEMQDELRRRAEARGQSPEDTARDIIHDALFRERLDRILAEEGIGAALYAIGREFEITDEFDNLRRHETPRAPDFT